MKEHIATKHIKNEILLNDKVVTFDDIIYNFGYVKNKPLLILHYFEVFEKLVIQFMNENDRDIFTINIK